MLKKFLHNFWSFCKRYKVHIFPIILLSILLVLVVFRISGSSVGVYFGYLNGDKKDPHLLYGKPQPIRSDEWLVATQLTIAQVNNGFKMNNSNFNGKQDVSVILDAPYSDWSAAFKPQNLAFFILPLEYAFALKWWFLLGILAISSYYFFLKILKNRIVLAVLFSCLISFSPFIFWWYQSATILPFAYGFLIMLIGMSIIDRNLIKVGKIELTSRVSGIIKVAVLSYLLVSFALILYPPFQITVGLGVSAFLFGYLLNHWPSGKNKKAMLSILLPFIAAAGIAIVVCLIFLATRIDTVHAITGTVYPGKRDVSSGEHDLSLLLVNYLQPLLQSSIRGGKFVLNQSESSSFILLPLFYLLPACSLLVYRYVKKRRIDWILALLLLCTLIFLCHLIVPLPHVLTHLFLLHMVPMERVIAGIGFCGIILVAYLTSMVSNKNIISDKERRAYTPYLLLYSLGFLVISCVAGFAIMNQYPGFIQSKKEIIILSLVLTSAMFLSLTKKFYIGLGILVIFTAASIFRINPLYQGLEVLTKNPIVQGINETSEKNTVWAAANDLYLENLPELLGKRAVTGVAGYPNIQFWQKYAGDQYAHVYNRYAHIVGSSSADKPISLVQPDYFVIAVNCSSQFTKYVDRVLTSLPLNEKCVRLHRKISLPTQTFYIYDISKP